MGSRHNGFYEGEEMKVRVWLKGHEEDARELQLKGLITDPITPMNVKDYLCRTGVYSWKDYQRIRYQRLKEAVQFVKKSCGFTYIILNLNNYERFWKGRKPSTRDIFEEWLHDPYFTMRTVSLRHGKRSISLLLRLNRELKKQEIMRRK